MNRKKTASNDTNVFHFANNGKKNLSLFFNTTRDKQKVFVACI